jgi:hypothetical protein
VEDVELVYFRVLNVYVCLDSPESIFFLVTNILKSSEFVGTLGYGVTNDLKNLYAQLSDIEKKTTDGKFGSGFFAKIKSSLAELVKSHEDSKKKEPASKKDG